MTIEKKLEKKIDSIVQMTGEYPKELEVSQEEYEKLGQAEFRGCKLKIKE